VNWKLILTVPRCSCASPAKDDEALKRQRAAIRDALLNGKSVVVSQEGALQLPSSANQASIEVPPGKLASFYWYQSDPELYQGEVAAMNRFFPGFKLQRESDGRLSWLGFVTPGMLGDAKRSYYLQAVYEHSHPSNDSFGGSIKVYSIDPDLNEIAERGPIPHTLCDSAGQIYICTARPEDFNAGRTVTSAASAIAWAVKWISTFELWLDGEISTASFRDHKV
jgi:hypothetical protein